MTSMTLRLAALACVASCFTPAHAGSGWVPTAAKAITIRSGIATMPAAASMPLEVTVGLRLQNREALKALVTAVNTPGNPMYGHFLTPNQFAAQYSPSAAQAQAVANYLVAAGFRNVQVSSNRLLITASGTVASAQTAFHTTLTQFSQGGKVYIVNTQDAQVPAALSQVVVSVMGLNSLPIRHQSVSAPSTSALLGLSPHSLQQAYDAGSTPTGANTTIAIFAFGDMTGVLTDLSQFESLYGVPSFPVSVVKVGAGPWTDDSGRTEWDMDTQTSTGIAGGVQQLVIYDGGSAGTDMPAAFNRFVTDNLARAGSVSISGCEVVESLIGGGIITTEDQIFEQAAAQGQTVFASTGDTGATCYDFVAGIVIGGAANGVPDGGLPLGQGYPASSPFVIAAGGTTLTVTSSGAYDIETAWDAGGGGISLIESAPSWQAPVLPLATVNGLLGFRGVPDVAMDADFLLSPAAIVVNGASTTNGGTSLSSPLSLGVWARLESAHGNALGFAGPALYALAHPGTPFSSITGFHDIVVGNNGLYSAHPGWDYTTGLGSFDISAVNALIH